MEISISISRSHENRRDAPRIVEKPRETSRSHERRPEKPLEASRRTEETRESSTVGFSGHFEFREGSLSALLFVCLPPAPQKIMVQMVKERNRSKTRSFFHVIRLYCYPNSFSNISDLSSIGYNIHLHYMILLYIEH